MLSHFVAFIHTHILPLGAWGVFAASLIEEIFAFIPSAFVILGAGFLFVHGKISWAAFGLLFGKVAVPAAIGVTLGSLVGYGIVYFAGKPVLEKWGKWIGFTWTDIEKFQARFEKSSFNEWSLFLVRALPIVPNIVVSVFCGLVRFPFWAYVVVSFVGFIVRTTIYGFVGWQVGKLYFRFAARFVFLQNVVAGLIVLAVVVFVVYRIMAVHRRNAELPRE